MCVGGFCVCTCMYTHSCLHTFYENSILGAVVNSYGQFLNYNCFTFVHTSRRGTCSCAQISSISVMSNPGKLEASEVFNSKANK